MNTQTFDADADPWIHIGDHGSGSVKMFDVDPDPDAVSTIDFCENYLPFYVFPGSNLLFL